MQSKKRKIDIIDLTSDDSLPVNSAKKLCYISGDNDMNNMACVKFNHQLAKIRNHIDFTYYFTNIETTNAALTKSFENCGSYMDNIDYIMHLKTHILNAVKNIKIMMETTTFCSPHCKDALIFKNEISKTFCFKYERMKCPIQDTNYISSMNYEEGAINCIMQHSQEYLYELSTKFFQEMAKIEIEMQKLDMNSFLNFFMKNRRLLEDLLAYCEDGRIFLIVGHKRQILLDLFHVFKSKHLDLKICLIPEFYSILFLLIARSTVIGYYLNNSLFVSLYFYFRILNSFFDLISAKKILLEDKQGAPLKNIEMRRQIISLLVRYNFIEPILLIVTKNQKLTFKYRFNYLFLFIMELKCMMNAKYNSDTLVHLRSNIWFVCTGYDFSKEELNFSSDSQTYFQEMIRQNLKQYAAFIALFNKYRETFPLLSPVVREKQEKNSLPMMHYSEFIKFCEGWKDKCEINNISSSKID